jgi:hypothetical protein
LHWFAFRFEDAVRSFPAFMAEAKQPGGPTGIVEANVPRVHPDRREKLRALSHDAV